MVSARGAWVWSSCMKNAFPGGGGGSSCPLPAPALPGSGSAVARSGLSAGRIPAPAEQFFSIGYRQRCQHDFRLRSSRERVKPRRLPHTTLRRRKVPLLDCGRGGVSERFKETVLKTVVAQKVTVGSNPTPSAMLSRNVHLLFDAQHHDLVGRGLSAPDFSGSAVQLANVRGIVGQRERLKLFGVRIEADQRVAAEVA